jgi:glycosyltransferase involved in cell wall biosynthesis
LIIEAAAFCYRMIRSMRLLLLLRQLNVGGAQRQVVELLRGLDRERFDVTVVTLYPGGMFAAEVEAMPHVRSISIDKKSRWEMFGFLWRLVKTVRRAKPDVIHSYLALPDLLAVLLKLVVPGVKVVWGIRASDIDLRRYDRLQRFVTWLQRRLARFPDLIIFNSEAGLRHHVASGFPAASSIVIQNGIDVHRFRPGGNGQPLRDAWSIRAGELVFGTVGRIDPTKDQLTFVRAAARVRERLPHARFVIIGPATDNYANEVRGEAARLSLDDVVVFTGPLEVNAETYAALDVFVSCSSSEGFPNAVAEALACGRRCVVTDAGDSAAIAGAFGIVAPPRDPEALAAAMIRAVDLRVDASEAARSVAERFGTDVLARKTAEALERMR